MEWLDEKERLFILPDLPKAEYDALTSSIQRLGVLVPVEVLGDEDGPIIDGYQRWKVCVELGLPDPPLKVRDIETPEERREHAIVLNLARRQMDPVTRAEAVKALALARGIDLGKPGRKKKNEETLKTLALEIGIPERTIRRDQELLKVSAEIQEKVRKGEITARAALSKSAKPKAPDQSALAPNGEYHALLIEPDWSALGFHAVANLKLPDGRQIKDLIHPDGCHLYLRLPPDHIAKGPALLSEWGFEYADFLTVETGDSPGRYFKRNTTHLMFGVRGEQDIRGKHGCLFTDSGIKGAVRTLLGKASPGPYLGLHVRDKKWEAYDPVTGDVLEPA